MNHILVPTSIIFRRLCFAKKMLSKHVQPAQARIVCALDIEVTGEFIPLVPDLPASAHDEVFAVGACVYDMTTGQVLRRRRWVIQLSRPDCENWEQVWRASKFEMRCFTEFWGKPEQLRILDKLMTQYPMETYPRERRNEMWHSIALFLLGVQREWPNHIRVSDTMDFDFAHISNAVVALDGAYRRVYYDDTGFPKRAGFVGSVRDAALGLDTFAEERGEEEKRLLAFHKALALPESLQHSHDPQDDAECIARQFAHFYTLARMTPQERLDKYGAESLGETDRRVLGL